MVVRSPPDPATYAWQGGAALAKDDCYKDISVSRLDFLERGHDASAEKFYM